MRKYLAKNKAMSLLASRKGPIKLNIGSGTDYKRGWINIDNNSDDNIEKLDLNWDLRYPLPFPDNSVDFIFNEHFVEHLTVEEARAILADLKRVLKAGGVLRIAMPDLAMVVDQYMNVDLADDPVIKRFKMDFIQTKAERINMSFRWWGHKWLYDWEELDRRLRESGFVNTRQGQHGKSRYKELCKLETRDESVLIAEATK